MAPTAEVAALVAMPVTSRPEAEAFIRQLHSLGLDYHFDDGAVDCLHRNGLVTRRAAERIDYKIRLAYAAWRASGADMREDCPIGFLLQVQGHVMEN